MSGQNRLFVTDGPVEFEKKPSEVQDFREITDRLEEYVEYTSKY
jgi:hypothetical protein